MILQRINHSLSVEWRTFVTSLAARVSVIKAHSHGSHWGGVNLMALNCSVQ